MDLCEGPNQFTETTRDMSVSLSADHVQCIGRHPQGPSPLDHPQSTLAEHNPLHLFTTLATVYQAVQEQSQIHTHRELSLLRQDIKQGEVRRKDIFQCPCKISAEEPNTHTAPAC